MFGLPARGGGQIKGDERIHILTLMITYAAYKRH
jgi:hypothetical protein